MINRLRKSAILTAAAGLIRAVVTGLTGEVDDFTVLDRDDGILAALNPSSQVVLIRPGGQPRVLVLG
jgi:hypothetical protein